MKDCFSKGSDLHYFGCVCPLSAIPLAGKVTQRNVAQKRCHAKWTGQNFIFSLEGVFLKLHFHFFFLKCLRKCVQDHTHVIKSTSADIVGANGSLSPLEHLGRHLLTRAFCCLQKEHMNRNFLHLILPFMLRDVEQLIIRPVQRD